MIETYCPAVHDELVKIGVNSKGGRGGMTAKMQAAWMAAQQGVTTVIANGKASDSLLQVRKQSKKEKKGECMPSGVITGASVTRSRPGFPCTGRPPWCMLGFDGFMQQERCTVCRSVCGSEA